MTAHLRKVTLENTAKEKLTNKTIKDIDKIEIIVWEKVEPGISLVINKKNIELRIIYQSSMKKFIAWLSGITVALGGVIAILKWLLPIIIGYFAQSPP